MNLSLLDKIAARLIFVKSNFAFFIKLLPYVEIYSNVFNKLIYIYNSWKMKKTQEIIDSFVKISYSTGDEKCNNRHNRTNI
jgi:hypothetical protein